MSESDGTREETEFEREHRLRAAELAKHKYRIATASGDWTCSCGADAEEDGADVAEHIERACQRAVSRGDG